MDQQPEGFIRLQRQPAAIPVIIQWPAGHEINDFVLRLHKPGTVDGLGCGAKVVNHQHAFLACVRR